MRLLTLAPLWRSTIGYDRLFDLVDAAQQQAGTEDHYPPCNVERVGEAATRSRWRFQFLTDE